jgi:hypothetical protein
MKIRAKMYLDGVYAQTWGGVKAIFRCTYDPSTEEDLHFQKMTPTGTAEFVVDNPEAAKHLIIGEYYYFDIEQCPKLPASEKPIP